MWALLRCPAANTTPPSCSCWPMPGAPESRRVVRAASTAMVLFNKVALSSHGFRRPTALLLLQFAACAARLRSVPA